MKAISTKYICIVFTMLVLASCKKEENEPNNSPTPSPVTDVSIKFKNQIDGQDIQFGKMIYTNAAGNMYQVDLLKYYVSNIVLVKNDGSEFALNNYDLINAKDTPTCVVQAGKVPNGTYTKMKFFVGIPQSRNHNGAQEGDLDPSMGMIWDWNTGYIFFKHEGKYKNTGGETKPLTFHFGTDRAFTTLETPISLEINGTSKTMHVLFNLNKAYTTPDNIDFNIDNSRQSSSASDFPWIDKLKANFGDAFAFDKVE